MLLSAYRQGCFPWYSEGEPLLWWSPDPRFVLYPEHLHIGETLRKVLKKKPFRVTFDTAFESVLRACAAFPRPGQKGTWITEDIVRGYLELHRLGFSHSTEVWEDTSEGAVLVGGLWGELIDRVYFGESMVALKSNASKVGFVETVRFLTEKFDVRLIDAQVETDYLASFGAVNIPRKQFFQHLKDWSDFPKNRGSWKTE
jgi:leucyl/phenylalanyl-tRNA--protein transferase